MGAALAFGAALSGYSIPVSVLVGALASAAASLVFGVLALTFRANQCAVGLALAIFGAGGIYFEICSNSLANTCFALPGCLMAFAFSRLEEGSPTTMRATMPIA